MPNHGSAPTSTFVVYSKKYPLAAAASLPVNAGIQGSVCRLILGVVYLVFSLGWSSVVQADAVTGWNGNASKPASAMCNDALHESRMYAMMHIAIHDALNAIERRFQPYIIDLPETSGASAEAAVATAARDVLVPLLAQLPPDLFEACIPAAIDGVEADYTAALNAIADGTSKTQGIVIGHAAAAVILALRVADGADTPFLYAGYPEGTNPGEYRSPPGFPFAIAPGWGNVMPFVLDDSAQFRPGLPYAVTSEKYTADFNEIKSLGAKDGSTRTEEQTQIAHFWLESSLPGWNRIARTVSTAWGLNIWESARLFALLNMALADGYIGSFETKYHYNYWRPLTAIQFADTDGNPDTDADPAWVALDPTPLAHPEYDSAHSVEGGAAAEVLQRVFETDQVSFSTCSLTLPFPEEQCGGVNEVRRSYSSFSQAADENGVSRILVGYHFRKAVEEGIKHGRKIGKYTVEHFLKAVE